MNQKRDNYLHIFIDIDGLGFYVNSFFDFIQQNFDIRNHIFLNIQISDGLISNKKINKISRNSKSFFLLLRSVYKSDKIFLHGCLARYEIIVFFFLQPWLLKKCYWLIWGGDLYGYKTKKRKLKSLVYEKIRRSVFSKMGNIITYMVEDFNFVKNKYGAKSFYHECLMYPNVIYENIDIPQEKGKEIVIQVGNSADSSQNHIDVFKELVKKSNYSFKIICPLSYGDPSYAESVIKEGKLFFGDNFIPLTKIISLEDYSKILSTVDIAIFNYKEGQKAMGNIVNLIGLGKKVYIGENAAPKFFFKDKGITIFDFNQFNLEPISQFIAENNKNKIRSYFSKQNIVNQWNRILEF